MKHLILLIALFSQVCLFAQHLNPKVLGNAGQVMASSDTRAVLSFTIGEMAVTTLNQGNLSLGQGFHNAALRSGTVGTATLNLEAWKLKVYPVPTDDVLYIQFQPPQANERLQAKVVNLIGQPTGIQFPLEQSGLKTISLAALPSGVYFLQLQDHAGRIGSVRMVKI
jgi:hypothetical protein